MTTDTLYPIAHKYAVIVGRERTATKAKHVEEFKLFTTGKGPTMTHAPVYYRDGIWLYELLTTEGGEIRRTVVSHDLFELCDRLYVVEVLGRPGDRRYGRHAIEDKARCVVAVFGEWHNHQCRRKRGHGAHGLLCGQHAKKATEHRWGEDDYLMTNAPRIGSWQASIARDAAERMESAKEALAKAREEYRNRKRMFDEARAALGMGAPRAAED